MTDVIAVSLSDVGHLAIPNRPGPLDASIRAAEAYLISYTGHTRAGYEHDLTKFFEWCAQHDLIPLEAKRPHLEAWIRYMKDDTIWKSATIAKRYDTIRGYYRAADRDEVLPGKDPCTWITRPQVDKDEQRRTVLNVLEHGRFVAAAEKMGPRYHAFCRVAVLERPPRLGGVLSQHRGHDDRGRL